MRILNVNATLDPVTGGGTAERTIQMSRALRTAGVDCSILTTNIGLSVDSALGLDGVYVTAFRCLSQRYFIPLARYKTIKRVVEGADVVHLMGHWTVLNALVNSSAACSGMWTLLRVTAPAEGRPKWWRARSFVCAGQR